MSKYTVPAERYHRVLCGDKSNRHRRRNLTSRRHAELILLPLSTRDSALPADGKKIAEEEVPLQGQNQSTEKKQGLGEKTAARYQGERESSAKAS